MWFSLLEKNYTGIPYLETQKINRDFIKYNNLNICDLLINNITCGCYTQLCLNEFYIPTKAAYTNRNFIHDNLITGFDKEHRQFKLLGYNKENKLSLSTVAFEEVEKAFLTIDSLLDNSLGVGSMDYVTHIFMLTKKEGISYTLDKICIKEALVDYLYGNSYDEKFRMINNPNRKKLFGMNVYPELSRHFLERDSRALNDIRILHLIYEHKKVMVMRIRFLFDNKCMKEDSLLLDEFMEIEKKALVLRNLHIKYLISKETLILDIIAADLISLYKEERILIEKLIKLF
ncbi:hypothetical protein SAMN02745217_04298 [Anaerocolumna xylanovorans DSM 12503]|uniref:Uncharacterized protein n=2 Tax=Anaerocolumna TaxID=1843210 RepID=A0A1M7YMB0_9FIRM|nr:hypothetical protein SAMN02745217_04298 [Anaerocolumna xylanovorans DSM 12503]